MQIRIRRFVIACLLMLLVTIIGYVERVWRGRGANVSLTGDAAMEKFRDDPNFGAAERVRAYIADAYVWEKNVMVPDPDINSKLRSQLQTGRPIQQGSSLAESLKARGRALLDSRNSQLNSLREIASIHWIGDEWKEEASLISNPPKHDPEKEVITGLRKNEDGSVEVTTQHEAEQRVYRVEFSNDKWLIRKYDWHPIDGN